MSDRHLGRDQFGCQHRKARRCSRLVVEREEREGRGEEGEGGGGVEEGEGRGEGEWRRGRGEGGEEGVFRQQNMMDVSMERLLLFNKGGPLTSDALLTNCTVQRALTGFLPSLSKGLENKCSFPPSEMAAKWIICKRM